MTWMRQKPDSEPSSAPAPTASSNPPARRSTPPPPTREAQPGTGKTVNIGPSVNIKGTLSGREDLTVDGKVEGKITLKEHVLTIGSNGQIQADLQAKAVIVHGKVAGNITAEDKVEITSSGTVHGDIRAPRVALADGAMFRGAVDMDLGSSAKQERSRNESVATTREMPQSAKVAS